MFFELLWLRRISLRQTQTTKSTLCPLQEVKLFDEHEIKLIEDSIGQRRYVTWNVEFCAQFFSSFDAISDSLLAPLPSEIRPVGICYLSLVKDFFIVILFPL